MTIKITNGEVQLKEFCTRGLKKEVNKILSESVEMSSDDGKSKIGGFTVAVMDKANDALVLGMIENIIINNEDVKISIETLDSLNNDDYDKVFKEVDQITNTSIPND